MYSMKRQTPPLVALFCALFISIQATAADLVLVAGATGKTGQHVVSQLLENGYAVRALVRNADTATEKLDPQVELAVGDVTVPESLKAAFKGVTQVVSAIGASEKEGPNSPEFVDYAGNNSLVDAAHNAGVEQFVLVSSMGVTHEDHVLNRIFGNVLIWKMKSEDYLRNSGVHYTIIRPGGLHDKAGGEQLVVFEQADTVKTVSIARADVATVCVAALGNVEAIDKTFEVFTVKMPPENNWQEKFAALD